MYKLTFTLKQHTPLIHFQSDQQGATLRASEVKPRLDRFILERFGGFEAMKSKRSDPFIGNGEHSALNYKLKIEQKEVCPALSTKNPNYFGNTGSFSLKGHCYGKNELICTIIFWCESLNKCLSPETLRLFFLLNNFGCRKTKGSGSYTLTSFKKNGHKEGIFSQEDDIRFYTSNLLNKSYPEIFSEYLVIEIIDHSSIFKVIDYYWKRLKSGINYTKDDHLSKTCNGEHKKSFLYSFIKENTWEKRWLKEKFIHLSPLLGQKLEPKFCRALLGLPDKYTFLDSLRLKKYVNVPDRVAYDFKFDINVKSASLERIPSPITFKPIIFQDKAFIFFLFDNDYASWDIQDKEFTFKMHNLLLPLFCGEFRGGRPIPTYIKRDEFNNKDELLYNHKQFIKENPSYQDQSKKLEDFFQFTIPKAQKLKTSAKGIELGNLLHAYHETLGQEFNALDFSNKVIAKVKIVKP